MSTSSLASTICQSSVNASDIAGQYPYLMTEGLSPSGSEIITLDFQISYRPETFKLANTYGQFIHVMQLAK
ncbi:MAG: hypothetical protein ACTH5D_01715 [Halomonas sp.]|uniref:hypothetical protein n=1 Tax=Halomonas sp. TaxID=1486246 RepID=UPI003F904F92